MDIIGAVIASVIFIVLPAIFFLVDFCLFQNHKRKLIACSFNDFHRSHGYRFGLTPQAKKLPHNLQFPVSGVWWLSDGRATIPPQPKGTLK